MTRRVEPTVRPPAVTSERFSTVDITRGVALLGIMAVHLFGTFNDDGSTTTATILAGGRSATTSAFMTGI